MAIVLPWKCPKCDFRQDTMSDQGMPTCPTCQVRLKPAGPVQCNEEAKRYDADPFYQGKFE